MLFFMKLFVGMLVLLVLSGCERPSPDSPPQMPLASIDQTHPSYGHAPSHAPIALDTPKPSVVHLQDAPNTQGSQKTPLAHLDIDITAKEVVFIAFKQGKAQEVPHAQRTKDNWHMGYKPGQGFFLNQKGVDQVMGCIAYRVDSPRLYIGNPHTLAYKDQQALDHHHQSHTQRSEEFLAAFHSVNAARHTCIDRFSNLSSLVDQTNITIGYELGFAPFVTLTTDKGDSYTVPTYTVYVVLVDYDIYKLQVIGHYGQTGAQSEGRLVIRYGAIGTLS